MILKYRAWKNDGEYSRMITSKQGVFTAIKNCYDNEGIGEETTGYHYVDTSPNPNKYVLMQFTGLRDKNDVAIFEGDIVRIFDNEETDFGWNEEVIFHNGAFMAGNENLLSNVNFRSLVIGNVYEKLDKKVS